MGEKYVEGKKERKKEKRKRKNNAKFSGHYVRPRTHNVCAHGLRSHQNLLLRTLAKSFLLLTSSVSFILVAKNRICKQFNLFFTYIFVLCRKMDNRAQLLTTTAQTG